MQEIIWIQAKKMEIDKIEPTIDSDEETDDSPGESDENSEIDEEDSGEVADEEEAGNKFALLGEEAE